MNVNQMLCYQTLKMALGPVLGTIMRIRADGTENVPAEGAVLLVGNYRNPQFQEGVQWIYYRRIRIRIGRPIDLSGLYGQEIDRAMISQISGKIRRVVIKLYNGEEDERFLTGEKPFDIANDRV